MDPLEPLEFPGSELMTNSSAVLSRRSLMFAALAGVFGSLWRPKTVLAASKANDPQWDRLQETALKAADEPTAWLTELGDVYGEVGKHPEFVAAFTKWLKIIQSQGVVTAMGEFTESTRKAEASPIRTALEESTMAAAIDEAKNPGGN